MAYKEGRKRTKEEGKEGKGTCTRRRKEEEGSKLKKEKWGEHRTTERKNESMEDRDVTMRDVSPGDY